MKKFTNLGNTNKTTDASDNRHDFIKNLINESLSIENGEIKGKDVLSTLFNKMLDLNESKTTINVLENVKVLSSRNFSFQLINESIELEKKKIENIKADKPVEIVEEKVELLQEGKKCEECDKPKCDCDEEKDGKKRGEGDEEDEKVDKAGKKKNEKDEETEVVEAAGKHIFVTDTESTTDIQDLAKIMESIKIAEEEEKKKLE